MNEFAEVRPRWRWLYTIAALFILFVGGLLVSLILGANGVPVARLDVNAWLWWRGLIYLVLLLCWPLLVRHLARRRNIESTRPVGFRPLVILVVLYELLIAQNPIQALVGWAG